MTKMLHTNIDGYLVQLEIDERAEPLTQCWVGRQLTIADEIDKEESRGQA